MTKTALKAVILFALCPLIVSAKLHIVISVDDFAWLATHIVVVTEGDEIDGQVMVLESWQGDLKPGDSINIPELAKLKSEQSRHIECIDMFTYLGKCSDTTPQFVSGSRIIVFLRKKTSELRSEKWSAIGGVWIEQEIA